MMTPTIVHTSKAHAALLDLLLKVAESSAEVLLTGPSGVGKELYASFIHAKSPRADNAMVVINCANLSDEMMESEIYGHSRGAFTGAVTSRDGIAASADGGTLFLDEIDTLSLSCQAKLLRFVQQKEYRRLGETHIQRSNFRLIAAANGDLKTQVEQGSFRKDLYYRLRVVPVDIPPLSERPEDVPALLEHFIKKYAKEYSTPPITFSDAARQRLQSYRWPGNVRELENVVRYMTCLRLDRLVEVADLDLSDLAAPGTETAPIPSDVIVADKTDPALTQLPFNEAKSKAVEDFERSYIDAALQKSNGNVAKAARHSKKHRRSFFELMKRYGMSGKDFRG